MPLDYLAAYGAGVQVHVEISPPISAGASAATPDARMDVLFPAYQALEGSGGTGQN
jgi:hypothetical protein